MKEVVFHYALLIFSVKYMGCSFERQDGTRNTNGFQKILNESNDKPNKELVGKGDNFYNRSLTSQLQDNGMEM